MTGPIKPANDDKAPCHDGHGAFPVSAVGVTARLVTWWRSHCCRVLGVLVLGALLLSPEEILPLIRSGLLAFGW